MKNKSFTLFEVLITLGIIAILATSVIVLLNPAKRFEEAKDKQREIHLQTIYNAIEQKMTIEGGWFEDENCKALPQETVEKETAEGEKIQEAVFKTIGTGEGNYNLYSCLVPKYLVNPLYDPDGGSEEDTHYQIWQNPQTKYVTLRYQRLDPKNPERVLKEIVAGAKKYGILDKPRHVETKPVTSIAHTTAKGGGTVYDDGGAYVSEAGVIWAKSSEINCDSDLALEKVDMKTILRTIDGAGSATEGISSFSFDSNLHSLQPDEEYCVRAYARNEVGVGYGQVEGFETLDARPYVETLPAENVTNDAAQLLGKVETIADYPTVNEAYFCWRGPDPDITETCETVKSNIKAYPTPLEISKTLTGLTADNTYHFKACATAVGVANENCGDELSFETKISAPFVETLVVRDEDKGSDWAKVRGNVVSWGGADITRRGFCYHPYDNPCNFSTLPSQWCVDATEGALGPTDNGQFFATLTGLEPGNYNVCAFAENGKGLSFGTPTVSFETIRTPPKVTTKSASRGATPGSGVSGGIISSDGGEPITQKGVCWAVVPSIPDSITANCTNDGGGKSDFTSNIPVSATGLWANTEYNVRAYAINKIGTGWADNVEKIDKTSAVRPTLTTIGPKEEDIYRDSVKNVGGDITDHGGAAIGEMGICWSYTNPTPTINDASKDVTPNVNLGKFSTEITGLYADTFYYLRAYARNREGINYGDVKTFRTKTSDPPQVATNPGTTVIDYGENWAKIGGNVTSNGGDPGTIRGVCYSSTGVQNPTYEIEDGVNVICKNDGTTGQTGSFTIEIKDLAIRDASGNIITYYALAFAHNSAGSAYGYPSVSFQVGRKNGESCTDSPDGSKCQSGYCADDVCCDKKCDGTCQACVKSKTGVSDGICANIKDNTDPDKECTGTCRVCKSGACSNADVNTNPENECSTNECGKGYCSGEAYCAYYNYGEGNCPECKYCEGSTSTACVNRPNNTQDTTYPNTCSGINICYNGSCTTGKYYLYLTANTYNGNLKGGYNTAREGADARCIAESTNKPSRCTGTPWAFISIDSTDDYIANFPTKKGVIKTIPWYWAKGLTISPVIANDFDGLLGGSIFYSADTVSYTGRYWTGSTQSGTLSYYTCNNWSDNSTSYQGARGYSYFKDYRWLIESAGYCSDSYKNYLLCACLGI